MVLTVTANSAVKGNINVGAVNAVVTVAGSNATVTTSTVVASTYNNIANRVVFQTPIESFTSGRFTIDSQQDWSPNNQSVVLTGSRSGDGTSVTYTVTNMVFSGNLVVQDYNMVVAAGNLQVQLTSFLNANVTHKVSYQINN
jgi:hypothetical protein